MFPIMNCASWSVFQYPLDKRSLMKEMMYVLAGTEDAERTS